MAAQASGALAPPSPSRLEISEIRVHPVREPVSQRTYAVIEVRTRGGLTGFGESPVPSGVEVTRARQFWTGRQATTYATAPAGMPLAGAMDMALLDITGKACGAPVYRVLGGPTRNKARAFTSIAGPADLDRAAAAGYRAFSVPIPKPAARNQGQAYQRDLRAMFQGLRARNAGFEFVLDGGGALTPGDAGSVAATLERLHPLWLDDPCPVSNDQTIRKIAEESVVPLGFALREHGGYVQLLRESLIDVLRPDVALDGITAIRRIAAVAETYYVAVAPQNSGGPIATAAALQLAASLPNFFIQQIPLPAAEEDLKMRAAIADVEKVRDGFAALPTGPGLGITVNLTALERYHAA